MLCIFNSSNDPYFNLATEEYLLKEFSSDIFMLWRNHNAIIVGKHQNTLAEINYEFVRENNIKVVRRLSGGGTVFHDMGNINFTFIQKGESGHLVDFRKFTLPIIEMLSDIGIEAKFEGRNDLTIDGLKFSGNAEHVYKDRILHHGTLLFSSKMTDLTAALNVNPAKFKDKAVKSVRSRVTNISDHLTEPMNIETFLDRLMTYITKTREDCISYALCPEDVNKIDELVQTKYRNWEWNFGYSPRYNFQRSFKTAGGHIEVNLEVKDGIIQEAKLFGDYFNILDIADLEAILKGTAHDFLTLKAKLSNADVSRFIQGCSNEEFLAGIF